VLAACQFHLWAVVSGRASSVGVPDGMTDTTFIWPLSCHATGRLRDTVCGSIFGALLQSLHDENCTSWGGVTTWCGAVRGVPGPKSGSGWWCGARAQKRRVSLGSLRGS